ncbi:hypothetical protein FRX31_032924 [Thalictrum thalictroides]|uniref:Uncharacterized protein n=1 Tax=Thalictrum thalictroides TaxID=46969 RepID=A0A7J6UY35_THATH|nr:hypothetical protein FRX31_032924 [Thalictrum thalictroides]
MVTAHQIAVGCRFPLSFLDLDDYVLTLGHVRQTYYVRASDIRSTVPYYHFVKRARRSSIIEELLESDKPWADYPIIVSDLFGGEAFNLLIYHFVIVNTNTRTPKPHVVTHIEDILGVKKKWSTIVVYTHAKPNGDELITSIDYLGEYTLPVYYHYKCPNPTSTKGKSTVDRHS